MEIEVLLGRMKQLLLIVGILLICNVISLLLAMWLPYIERLSEEVSAAIQKVISGFEARMARISRKLFRIGAWRLRDLLPYERLCIAVESLGTEMRQRLEWIDGDLKKKTIEISALKPIVAVKLGEAKPVEDGVDSPWLNQLFFSGLFALLVGLFNGWILSMFFEGDSPIMLVPRPFPIYFHQVMGMLLCVIEWAAGFSLYKFVSMQSAQQAPQGSMKAFVTSSLPFISLIAIAALMVVETVAYSQVSVNMNIPQHLRMDPDSGWGGILQFSLGGLGVALTLVLAGCGYLFEDAIEKFGSGVIRRRRQKEVDFYRGAAIDVKLAGKDVVDTWQRIDSIAEKLPTDIAARFAAAVGEPAPPIIAQAIREKAISHFESDWGREPGYGGLGALTMGLRIQGFLLYIVTRMLAILKVCLFVLTKTFKLICSPGCWLKDAIAEFRRGRSSEAPANAL